MRIPSNANDAVHSPSIREGVGGRVSRRVLMISAAFPPVSAPGVQRTAKLAKYLGRFGYAPIIWTSDRTEGVRIDKPTADDLPVDLEVHHSGEQRISGLKKLFRSNKSPVAWPLDRRETRALTSNPYTDWAQASLAPLAEWLAGSPVDLLYSSGSVAVNHVVAYALRRAFGIPWIADVGPADERTSTGSNVEGFFHARLERLILDDADIITTSSPLHTKQLAERAPDRADWIITRLDGYDPTDFAKAAKPDRYSRPRFVLTYTDRFAPWRMGPALTDALTALARDPSGIAEHIELRIVADIPEANRRALEECGVRTLCLDAKAHGRTIDELVLADALLMRVPDDDARIPEQTAEYLASGKPILMVGAESGACPAMVREVDAALFADDDPQSILKALQRLLRAWGAGRAIVGCPPPRLRDFTSIALTKKFAWYLDELTGASQAAPSGASPR